MSQNTQKQRLDQLLAHPASSALALASSGTACHLVGGTLRDTLLDLPCRDFDAVVEQNGAQVAGNLSTALGARLVHLGRDRFAAYRIVGPEVTVDLWDRQNQPLDKDLARRDLTINSMALDLDDRRLVDPCGGLHDLAEHRLRATSQQAFASDPLRVLRLTRFAGQLPDFAVEGQSLELARLAATGLSDVAPERIREELRLALEGESVHATIRLLVELGVYPGLWTQWTKSDRVGVDTELLATFKRLELLPAVLPPRVIEQIDRYLTRTALLLDQLAQMSGTPADELLTQSREKGYLTKREARDIRILLDWGELPEPREEQRWLLHITGRFWPSGVAYYGARIRESAAAATWPKILGDFLELIDRSGDEIFEPTPFLTGRDIQEILRIPPGPAIGELVGLLKREQIEGRIGNRREAEAYLVQTARAGLRADGTLGLQKDHQPGPRQEGLEIKRSPSWSPPDAD